MTEALTEYRRRQREPLGNRLVKTSPGPYLKFQPSQEEYRPCCGGIKWVSGHLKSAVHVAHIFGLDPDVFVAYVRHEELMRTWRERRTTHRVK